MTFLDTNIVLRWVLNDHAAQSSKVAEEIATAKESSYIIPDVILAEIYSVLRKKRRSNQQIAEVLNYLMEQPVFVFDNETRLARQIAIIRDTKLDFADCYLIARATQAGEPLKTFDKAMQKAYDRYKKLN